MEKTIKIVGKSNTGKTKNFLFNKVENLIENQESLVIIDNSLEYYNQFGQKLKDNNYNIKVVNFKEPLKSDGYDPIDYLKYLYESNKIDLCIEQIKEMGLNIFEDENYHGDPFWTNSAADYFTGIVLTLLKTNKETSFGSISNIINQGELKYKNSTILKTYCDTLDIMDPAYISMSNTLNAPNETRGSILSVVKQKLNLFFTRPELLKSFYNNNFNISKDLNKKSAIFIVSYKPLYDLSSIIINQIYNYIKNTNNNINFILDDFDELKINNISDMINSANKGIFSLYLTTKNKETLIDKYPKNTFINIEKNIELKEKWEENIKLNTYPLPNLKDSFFTLIAEKIKTSKSIKINIRKIVDTKYKLFKNFDFLKILLFLLFLIFKVLSFLTYF